MLRHQVFKTCRQEKRSIDIVRAQQFDWFLNYIIAFIFLVDASEFMIIKKGNILKRVIPRQVEKRIDRLRQKPKRESYLQKMYLFSVVSRILPKKIWI